MKYHRSILSIVLVCLAALLALPAFAAEPCLCEFGCNLVNMTTTTYNGTGGCDCVIGTSGADTINVFGGNDYVCSQNGADTVSGGSGDDFIMGGPGDDTLNGDGGDDYIAGGGDDDTIFGGSGSDSLYGEAGDDCLDGGLNTGDHLDGGSGTDTCINLATWANCEVGTGSC